MLFALFAVFIAISLTLAFLGYYSGESAYSIIGWTFAFFLGMTILLPGNLQYKTSITETYSYTNATLTTTIKTDNYTNLDATSSKFFGLWLTMASVAGIVIGLTEVQSAFSGKKNWRSE